MTTAPSQSRFSSFTMGIGPLLICGFSVPLSVSMIFPALSDLQDKYNFSDAGLGFIAAAGFIASLLVSLFVAPFADRGKPKRLVLIALLLASFGSLLFAFGSSLWMFITARAISGAALGTSGPAVKAIAANIDKARAAERLGRLRGVELAGFTGGPLVGAALISPLGLRGAFITFGIFALIAFVIIAPKELPSLPSTNESKRLSIELLKLRPVRAAALASLTLFIPVGIYDSLWDRYITDRGGNNFMVGMTFLLYTIPFILLGAKGGRIADQKGAARMTVIGIFLTAPLVLLYGFLPSAFLLVSFSLVEGVVGALSIPATQSLMAQVAPHGRASAAQGLNGTGDLIAGSLMALIAPIIYGSHGPGWTFGFATALMVVCGTAVALMLRTTADSRSTTN